MKYTIISINDDRKEYKDRIRARVGIPEVRIPAFDATTNDGLAELERWGIKIDSSRGWYPKRGELGIWLSTLKVWEWAVRNKCAILAFEDDAIPVEDFDEQLAYHLRLLPSDWDFMALWVPDNQRNDYYYDVRYDNIGAPMQNFGMLREERSIFRTRHQHLAKVYQGYGGVANMYSPKGAAKFLSLVKTQGLWTPCDCFLYLSAHAQHVDGYAPHPKLADPIVEYDWAAPTTIHHTERV